MKRNNDIPILTIVGIITALVLVLGSTWILIRSHQTADVAETLAETEGIAETTESEMMTSAAETEPQTQTETVEKESEETEADKLSEKDAYDTVIRAYKKILNGEWTKSRWINPRAISLCRNDAKARICYAYYDVDNNGVKELLIGFSRGSDTLICDMFGFAGDEPVNLLKEEIDIEDLLGTSGRVDSGSMVCIYGDGTVLLTMGGDGNFYKLNRKGDDLKNDTAAPAGRELDSNDFAWKVIGGFPEKELSQEEKMKKALAEKTPSPCTGWYYYDYNGDGKKEAYAITEDRQGTITIYLVTRKCTVENVMWDTYGYVTDVIEAGDERYLIWEQDAGGSASSSYILGVDKKDSARVPAISGCYMSFTKADSGEGFLGYEPVTSAGARDYEEYRFTYNRKTKEFELEEEPEEEPDDPEDGLGESSEFCGWYEYEEGELLSVFSVECIEGYNYGVLQFWHNYGDAASDEDICFLLEKGVTEYDAYCERTGGDIHVSLSKTGDGVRIKVTNEDLYYAWEDGSESYEWSDLTYTRRDGKADWNRVRDFYAVT